MNNDTPAREKNSQQKFSGHIFLFNAFDVGDDINLNAVQQQKLVRLSSPSPIKHFKNYHIPLTVDTSQKAMGSTCVNAKIHSFGVITLRYKIPFNATLEELRAQINGIYDANQDQSIKDANLLFDSIKPVIKQSRFFHLRNSYVLIQVNPVKDYDAVQLKKEFGGIIASTLRFELETLSEYKKNEILESGIRYYRGDLIIIDSEAAFIYDDEYEDSLDLFEFANMQQCELQYFDRMLDEQLSAVYAQKVRRFPFKTYLPFVGSLTSDPVTALGNLRVDISVITERLENSIKLADDVYYRELFALLAEKLDLHNWKESIDNKLDIIEDIATVHQGKADATRENMLSLAIILLFIIEITFGVLNLVK